MKGLDLLRARFGRRNDERRSLSTLDDLGFLYGGHQYPLLNTTWTSGTEEEPSGFDGFARQFVAGNPVVYSASQIRMAVFSQAPLVWRRKQDGRTVDTFTDRNLAKFQTPWPGAKTPDLLSRMSLHVDAAGNSFVRDSGSRLHMMRPDWTTILLGSDLEPDNPGWAEDAEVIGYWYRPNGQGKGRIYPPEDVAHFAPHPDPWALYRGMSWLTPIVREIQGDSAATTHKHKFFTNAATPNMVVKFDPSLTRDQVAAFKELMEEDHRGAANAYRTLYLGGGSDATVVGKDLQEVDFSKVQGKGETRILMAAGVHPVVAGASEGLSGSSLNSGNYNAAKRAFSDVHLQRLWMHAVASLEVLATKPTPSAGVELWFDRKDVPFLQDDLKDTSEIQANQAQAIRSLTEAGYEPSSVVDAVTNDDYSQLDHTGVFSVQLQPPGADQTEENARTVTDPNELRRLLAEGWTVAPKEDTDG